MAFDAYALWDDLEISLGFKSPPPDIDNKSLQYPEGGIAQLNLDFGVLDWSSYPKKFLSRACSPRDLKRHVQLPNLSVVSDLEMSPSVSWAEGIFEPDTPQVNDAKLEFRTLASQWTHFEARVLSDISLPLEYDFLEPIVAIQDSLLLNYFVHIHPLFPIVDEYVFTRIYHQYKFEDKIFNYLNLLLFQTMLFLGFELVDGKQLRQTRYTSVNQGREDLYSKIKALYRAQLASDPYVLTQVSLLLSLRSPGNHEPPDHSYWMGRLFYHAKKTMLCDRSCDKKVAHSRRKILWWCCLIRERMHGFRTWHQHDLAGKKSWRSLPIESDFGLEVSNPSYTTISCKQTQISSFVLLCKMCC